MENTIDGKPVTIIKSSKLAMYTFKFNATSIQFSFHTDPSYIFLDSISNDGNPGDGCKVLCFALNFFKNNEEVSDNTVIKVDPGANMAKYLLKNRTIIPDQSKLNTYYEKFGFVKDDDYFSADLKTLLKNCSNPELCQRKTTAGKRRKLTINKKRNRTRRYRFSLK